jgi:3-oxoacyl-[acyl-carrier protein] reductase
VQLEDDVVIVTGGGRGIGRTIALGYAKEGANLVLVARTKSEIEGVASEVQSLGREAVPIVADVSNEVDVNNMVDEAFDHYKRIDVLVNNAGILDRSMQEIKDLESGVWNAIIATNLTGVFLCSKAVIQKMIPQKKGSIINISSGFAVKGRAGYGAYSASKAGVERLTEVMSEECQKYNIAVNNLKPGGFVDTSIRERTPNVQARSNKAYREITSSALKPEVMVPAAIFLATQNSKGLTGATIVAVEWNKEHGY